MMRKISAGSAIFFAAAATLCRAQEQAPSSVSARRAVEVFIGDATIDNEDRTNDQYNVRPDPTLDAALSDNCASYDARYIVYPLFDTKQRGEIHRSFKFEVMKEENRKAVVRLQFRLDHNPADFFLVLRQGQKRWELYDECPFGQLESQLCLRHQAMHSTCAARRRASSAEESRNCDANLCRYTLRRRSTGNIGARGDYQGDGVTMKVFDVGSAQKGTLKIVATGLLNDRKFRYEAYCGAGQCDEFVHKLGPKGQVRFGRGAAVLTVPADAR